MESSSESDDEIVSAEKTSSGDEYNPKADLKSLEHDKKLDRKVMSSKRKGRKNTEKIIKGEASWEDALFLIVGFCIYNCYFCIFHEVVDIVNLKNTTCKCDCTVCTMYVF